MKLVYSNKSKKCLGEFAGIEGQFVKYNDDDGKAREAHYNNVSVIAEMEQYNEFMKK